MQAVGLPCSLSMVRKQDVVDDLPCKVHTAFLQCITQKKQVRLSSEFKQMSNFGRTLTEAFETIAAPEPIDTRLKCHAIHCHHKIFVMRRLRTTYEGAADVVLKSGHIVELTVWITGNQGNLEADALAEEIFDI